eukprot:7851779-Pyramimonas_sp.AAC.1
MSPLWSNISSCADFLPPARPTHEAPGQSNSQPSTVNSQNSTQKCPSLPRMSCGVCECPRAARQAQRGVDRGAQE